AVITRTADSWLFASTNGLEDDEPCDRGFRWHRGKPGNLFRRPAEAGAVEQVSRALGRPVRGANRRKVLFPAIRHLVSLLARCRSGRRPVDDANAAIRLTGV